MQTEPLQAALTDSPVTRAEMMQYSLPGNGSPRGLNVHEVGPTMMVVRSNDFLVAPSRLVAMTVKVASPRQRFGFGTKMLDVVTDSSPNPAAWAGGATITGITARAHAAVALIKVRENARVKRIPPPSQWMAPWYWDERPAHQCRISCMAPIALFFTPRSLAPYTMAERIVGLADLVTPVVYRAVVDIRVKWPMKAERSSGCSRSPRRFDTVGGMVDTSAAAAAATRTGEDWVGRVLNDEFFLETAFDGCDFSEVTTRGVTFADCSFRNVRFNASSHTNATFTNCTFIGCNLYYATFTNCTFVGSAFDTCRFEIVTVTGGDWSFVSMPSAQLQGVNFADVRMCEADLSKVNAGGAQLRNVDLSGAWLHQTIFSGADLRGSDLTSVDPHTTVLSRAVITPEQAMVVAGLLGVDIRQT